MIQSLKRLSSLEMLFFYEKRKWNWDNNKLGQHNKNLSVNFNKKIYLHIENDYISFEELVETK